MSDLETELGESSDLHAAYLRMLVEDGFTREEAFSLVLDHHALMSWAAIIGPSEGPPSWVASPVASSESSRITARSLRLLKPPTPSE